MMTLTDCLEIAVAFCCLYPSIFLRFSKKTCFTSTCQITPHCLENHRNSFILAQSPPRNVMSQTLFFDVEYFKERSHRPVLSGKFQWIKVQNNV